ncbi:MAG: hypothetical protein KGH65_02895 [Candidatus Micrarchaeota archaeon]|nr:hypothetical protein [Candidatus Micrarchaeota archaeon]
MNKIIDRENNLEGLPTLEKVRELLKTHSTTEVTRILRLPNGGLSKYTDVLHAEAITHGKDKKTPSGDIDAFKLARNGFKEEKDSAD